MDPTTEHGMLRRVVLWILLMQPVFGLHAQTSGVLVRVEDRMRVGARNRVVLRTTPGQVDREIYRSEGEIPGDVAVSPNIKSEEGRRIRGYVWCCGAGKMAILRGSSREDPTFRPGTLSVVDVSTGDEEPVPGVWRPYQMQWAVFDSSLYVKALPPPGAPSGANADFLIYRYHVPTRQLSLTSRHGVFFSPDGLYYFDAAVGEPGFRVFRSADDKDITSTLLPPDDKGALRPTGDWMPGAGHVLLFIEAEQHPVQPGRAPRGRPVRIDSRTPQVYTDRWNRAVDAESVRV